MPTKPDTRPFVLIYPTIENTDAVRGNKPALNHECYQTEDEAKERFGELSKEFDGEVYLTRELPWTAEVDTKPRVTFAPPHTATASVEKVKKPRARRRTAAEMEAARLAKANGKKAANGAVEVTS